MCRMRAEAGSSAGFTGIESGISRWNFSASGPNVIAGPSATWPLGTATSPHAIEAANGSTCQGKAGPWSSLAPFCKPIVAPRSLPVPASVSPPASVSSEAVPSHAGGVASSTTTSSVAVASVPSPRGTDAVSVWRPGAAVPPTSNSNSLV